MTCDAYQELIPEYLEKSLPSELEQELTRHMDTCAACQKYLQAAKALSAAIQTLPRHQSSTETRLKIIAAIQQTAPARRSGEFGPVLDMDDLAQYLRVDKTVLGTYLDDIPPFRARRQAAVPPGLFGAGSARRVGGGPGGRVRR